LGTVSLAQAQADALPTLQECAAIGSAADRLVCYDKLAGRAPAVPEPSTETPVPSTSELAPQGVAATPRTEAGDDTSVMSKFWELEPGEKRGTFNLLGYRANYVLPLHVTDNINRAPQSPTQVAVSQPNYRQVEAKFQMSLRTKLWQDAMLPGGDLWAAFTQQAMWQVWNGSDSKPFRNTDYEPEVTYVLRTPESVSTLPWGWRWRFSQLALAHQSNGQSDPLSRSWNRIYIGAGFDRGDWAITARLNQRLNEPYDSDNNPDLVDYRGRTEMLFAWTPGAATASLQLRPAAKGTTAQFEWSYPVFRAQPNGLRWYVQAFSGYGETLTDYNFHQTSVGFGLAFMQF
jgi:phospholipase A1